MNYQTIIRLQKEYGVREMQQLINSGVAWKMEGSIGRKAMRLLKCGACMLPKEFHKDYYGNTVPSRDVLKEGTTGTYKNSVLFWSDPENLEMFDYESF